MEEVGKSMDSVPCFLYAGNVFLWQLIIYFDILKKGMVQMRESSVLTEKKNEERGSCWQV